MTKIKISKKGPCYQCAKRTVVCHSACQEYKIYQKQLEELREKKAKEGIIDGYIYRRVSNLAEIGRKKRKSKI